MKKIIFAVAVIFLIGACLPLTPAPNPVPNVDVAGTNAAIVQTSVAQTLTALPTATSVPPSATLVTSDTPSLTPTTVAITDTAVTGTFAMATSTNVSGTPPTSVATGQVTPTWTLAVRTYGTLPPLVPFGHITLINRARAEAYISLHVDLDGSNTVIEYPVSGTINIQAPLGFYQYVAWVGGRKMVGEFRLRSNDDLTIILYRDRIVVQ